MESEGSSTPRKCVGRSRSAKRAHGTTSNQNHMIGDNQPTLPVVASSGGDLFTGAQNVFVTGSQLFGIHGTYNVCKLWASVAKSK